MVRVLSHARSIQQSEFHASKLCWAEGHFALGKLAKIWEMSDETIHDLFKALANHMAACVNAQGKYLNNDHLNK